jgi:hypothetical protein
MAETNLPATFSLELLSDDLVAAAARSTDAMQDLRAAIDEDVKSIGELNRAQRTLRQGGARGSDLDRQLSAQIAAIRQRSARRVTAFAGLGGNLAAPVQPRQALTQAAAPAQPAGSLQLGFRNLAQTAGQVPGLFGQIAQKALGVASALGGKGMALAVGASTVAVVAGTAAVAAATVALTKYSVAVSLAAQEEGLRLRALTAVNGSMVASAALGKQMQDTIDSIAQTSAVSREKLGGFAQSLLEQGLRPGDLAPALRAVSEVAATQGDKYASEFAKKVATASKNKLNIGKLTGKVHQELGGLAAEAFNNLSVQWDKLVENITYAINHTNLDKLTAVIANIGVTISGAKGSGNVVQSVVQTIVDAVAGGVSKVHLYSLKLVNFILEMEVTLTRAFHDILRTIEGPARALGVDVLSDYRERALARAGRKDFGRHAANDNSANSGGFVSLFDQVRPRNLGDVANLVTNPVGYASVKLTGAALDSAPAGYEALADAIQSRTQSQVPAFSTPYGFSVPNASPNAQVTVNVYGNATKDDAQAIGSAAGDGTGKALRDAARRKGL